MSNMSWKEIRKATEVWMLYKGSKEQPTKNNCKIKMTFQLGYTTIIIRATIEQARATLLEFSVP